MVLPQVAASRPMGKAAHKGMRGASKLEKRANSPGVKGHKQIVSCRLESIRKVRNESKSLGLNGSAAS
uniref:Uncharacterized protein n=1 Tax=Arion vulgaris TaxID=1028688 RepID=A0A0B7BM79_9EUPU